MSGGVAVRGAGDRAGAVLDVAGLSAAAGGMTLVSDVALRIAPGECIALVGASGSGKTVTARALLGLSAPGVTVSADRLDVAGVPTTGFSERRWRSLRGRSVGYVGQEALGALDPLRPVGREVADALRLHTSLDARERRDAVRDALERVGLDPAMATDGRLAGSLSGGMRQRALIAAATIGSPALLVADEPTTALDAGVAVTVMESLRAAQRAGAGLLVVTHDLGLVAGWADRVAVVHEGRIVEQGAVAAVFADPQHDATRALVHAATSTHARTSTHAETSTRAEIAAPDGSAPGGASERAISGERIDAEASRIAISAAGLVRRYDGVAAVDDVSLSVARGRTLGVVGASGSGKTTLVRMLLGLETPDEGTVDLDGTAWVPLPERERRPRRHRIAAVVQDPGATFDERWTVERVLVDALTAGARRRSDAALDPEVDAALTRVGLSPALRPRNPLTLSGGQRQRLAIARALAPRPEVLLLDEPVTALDATVQDAVLALLERLRDETGVAMVFVSHDLRAVRRIADDVVVMHHGTVVEHGPAARVFDRPAHPVTARLLRAAEVLASGPDEPDEPDESDESDEPGGAAVPGATARTTGGPPPGR